MRSRFFNALNKRYPCFFSKPEYKPRFLCGSLQSCPALFIYSVDFSSPILLVL
jgi:hypothetical protein